MMDTKQVDAFSNCHPIILFVYYLFVFMFTTFIMHPIFLTISILTAITYAISLMGRKTATLNLFWLLPVILVTALINPMFNNRGVTILTYLPSGNPLTLESIVYGLAAGIMLTASMMWFMTFNRVMTSDKFVYLFGRIIPSLSLILSMALRFVPEFKNKIKQVADTQRTIGKDVSNGSLLKRLRHGIDILSIMVTWALENAIETSDSMKSRGYGLPGRTAYSIYQFDKRDQKILSYLFVLISIILIFWTLGFLEWRYFPMLTGSTISIQTMSVWLSYLLFCLTPILVNKEEERQWKATQLNI